MSFARALLSRIGLIGRAKEIDDDYDMRLRRIGAREAAHAQRAELFRSEPTLREV